jgi:hypothetical protein
MTHNPLENNKNTDTCISSYESTDAQSKQKTKNNPVAKSKVSIMNYNEFITGALYEYKRNNPDVDHKTAFIACADMWKKSPHNPNNN